MFWTKPHLSKIYEALGAIADNRIEFVEGKNEAKMYSSSGNKFYTVTWNNNLTEMMANDNSAFFNSKLSYPMISVLLLKGKISYPADLADNLKGIKWKDINQKFKNNFDRTIKFVLDELETKGIDREYIQAQVTKIAEQLETLQIGQFGKKAFPPKGY